jgi:hypothetical protein
MRIGFVNPPQESPNITQDSPRSGTLNRVSVVRGRMHIDVVASLSKDRIKEEYAVNNLNFLNVPKTASCRNDCRVEKFTNRLYRLADIVQNAETRMLHLFED